MLAGVDAIRGTPATDPRFLVVFSDGEDLNSGFKADVVSQAAQAVPNLHVYAIDYMPGPNLDHFLETFASQHGGQARKAGSGADLLSLFQNFASRMDDLYIVSFAFAPPAAGVTPKPAEPTAAPPAEAAAAPQPAATATLAPEATAVPLAATVPAAEPAAPEAQAKSNWWLWVILLIVVIIIVIFATRKSKEKEQQKR
jgi:hypothetical protein